MSRNGTSAIYESTYYLGIVYVKLTTEQKLHGVSTYLPNPEALCLEHVGTPVWPRRYLAQDQGLWVARNTFL